MNALAASIDRQLALCAAALAGAAAASPAQAVIVTFHTPVAVPNTFTGVYLNFLTGANGASAAAVPGWDFNPWSSNNQLAFFWPNTSAQNSGGLAATPDGPYLDLPAGSYIGPQSTFSTSWLASRAIAFQTPGNHVLGFRFFNETTSAVNYGFLSITTGGASGFPAVINGWSFENTGGALLPEASTAVSMSLGLLALGAAALRRRSRRSAARG